MYDFDKLKTDKNSPKDIPSGVYRVELMTTTNQGADLLFTYKIISGKYKDRRIHSRWMAEKS